MELVLLKKRCEKIYIYFNAKNEDYHSLNIFGLLFKYLKDVCETNIIIPLDLNSVRYGFDCSQKCHKIVQIMI